MSLTAPPLPSVDLPTNAASPVPVTAGTQSRVEARAEADFVDRRGGGDPNRRGGERRQFGSTHLELSDDGRELALAIDAYKVENHRRYLTCDELLVVIKLLGYRR